MPLARVRANAMSRSAVYAACVAAVMAQRPDVLHAVMGTLRSPHANQYQSELPALVPAADEALLPLFGQAPVPKYHPIKGCHWEVNTLNFCFASPNMLASLMNNVDP